MTSIFPPFNRRTSFRKQPYFFEAGRGVNSKGLAGPIPALSLTFTSGALDPRITFSRPSLATYFDSTGKLTYAPNNLLVNTATLSTQTVSTNIVAGFDVILSFTGTGSVAISGGHTATLAGTGATNRVFLKFTPTTTSLTFTVTGTVTEAMLERVTYQTTPSTYVANTVSPSSQYFGPRFEYDPVTLVPRGLLIEEAMAANLALHSADFTNAVWSFTGSGYYNSTTASFGTSVSPDGTSNGSTITSSNVISARAQSVLASASTTYTFSVWLRAGSLTTGTVRIGLDAVNGSAVVSNLSYTPFLTLTSSWQRFTVTGTMPASGADRIAAVINLNAAGTVNAFGAQLEARSFATSYLPTGASTAARSADVVSMTGTNFSSWYSATQGTFVCTSSTFKPTSSTAVGFSFIASDGTTSERIQSAFDTAQVTAGVFDGGVSQASFTSVYTPSGATKVALAVAAGNFGASFNGGAATSVTSGTMPTVNRLNLGSDWAGNSFFLNGHIASIQYYTSRLSNDQLQALTQPSLEASMFLTFDTSSDSFVDASWGP